MFFKVFFKEFRLIISEDTNLDKLLHSIRKTRDLWLQFCSGRLKVVHPDIEYLIERKRFSEGRIIDLPSMDMDYPHEQIEIFAYPKHQIRIIRELLMA